MSRSHRERDKITVSNASLLRVDRGRFLMLAGALASGACGSSGSTDSAGVGGSVGATGGGAGATGGGGAAGAAGTGAMDATAGGACVPGDQKACACLGGGQGIQVCNPSGTGYEPCSGCGQDAAPPLPDGGATGNPCGICDGCCNGKQCVTLATESAASCGKKG